MMMMMMIRRQEDVEVRRPGHGKLAVLTGVISRSSYVVLTKRSEYFLSYFGYSENFVIKGRSLRATLISDDLVISSSS